MEYKLLVFSSGMLILKKHNGMYSFLFLKANAEGTCLPLGFSYFLHYHCFRHSRIWVFFLIVRLGKKPRCTWILKHLEEISWGILCSKNAVCSKSVSWLLWNWTFYPIIFSSSRASSAFFFLSNSADSNALGPWATCSYGSSNPQ